MWFETFLCLQYCPEKFCSRRIHCEKSQIFFFTFYERQSSFDGNDGYSTAIYKQIHVKKLVFWFLHNFFFSFHNFRHDCSKFAKTFDQQQILMNLLCEVHLQARDWMILWIFHLNGSRSIHFMMPRKIRIRLKTSPLLYRYETDKKLRLSFHTT